MKNQNNIFGVAVKCVQLAATEINTPDLARIFHAEIGEWVLHLPNGDYVRFTAQQFHTVWQLTPDSDSVFAGLKNSSLLCS